MANSLLSPSVLLVFLFGFASYTSELLGNAQHVWRLDAFHLLLESEQKYQTRIYKSSACTGVMAETGLC